MPSSDTSFCVLPLRCALHIKKVCGQSSLIVVREGVRRLSAREIADMFTDNPRLEEIASEIVNRTFFAMHVRGDEAVNKLVQILREEVKAGTPIIDTEQHFGCRLVGYAPRTPQQAERGLRHLFNNTPTTPQPNTASANRPGNHKDFARRRKG